MNTTAINSIRLDVVAKLVGNQEDVTATRGERAVADVVRRCGEEMERRGYLPAIRRQQMMRVMKREAELTSGNGERKTIGHMTPDWQPPDAA